MDGEGNLVVVELKRGQTPRDVTSQALEYSSWVKDLEFEEIKGIADSYTGFAGALETAFREKFGSELPDELNQTHRSVIVAESVDASTDRIVRYLAEMEVPINVATVQHFEDANGRELLAQVYLIEPESVQPRARRTSARCGYRTVNGLQDLADENGIGEIYRGLRDGVRGIFFAQGYKETVAYVRKLENGGVRDRDVGRRGSGRRHRRRQIHRACHPVRAAYGRVNARPSILVAGQHDGQRREALERQFPGGARIGPGVGGPVPQQRGGGQLRGETLVCVGKALPTQRGRARVRERNEIGAQAAGERDANS